MDQAFAPLGSLCKAPTDFEDSPLSQACRQPLLLGLFLDLTSGRKSNVMDPKAWTFENNADVIRRADALGFDLAFSRAQWLPKGSYDGDASLDAFMTMAAMVATTSRIILISSLHVLYGPLHPLHIAKFGATLDHISKGRWGINVLTGHRAVEHEMFGWQQIEHDQRYELAAELFDVVKELWRSEENVTYAGRSPWRISNGFVTPRPAYGRPVLVNATGSTAGIEFAARYSDLIFVTSPGGSRLQGALDTLPSHIENTRRVAAEHGRRIRTLINPIIVSRDTEAETEAYADHIAGVRGPDVASFASDAHAWRNRQDPTVRQGRGLGGNIEIVGTPEQVVEQLAALKGVGIDGVQIGFFDWKADLDHFGERILPLLHEAGLRIPAPVQATSEPAPAN